jgi:hypothetical protein
MTADRVFEQMELSNIARRELMYQMKLYRTREKPFDIAFGITELPITWWSSIEDSFLKGEDYLVQLALKLFSITPHAAGCERVWSNLGWLYGTRRNRLGLNKIENMYKLAAYYHTHAKQELPYYGAGKTVDEIYDILIDANLNPDEELIDFSDNVQDIDEEIIPFDKEEDDLIIDNVLNLDTFIENLDEIIEDNIDEEVYAESDYQSVTQESDIEWNPDTEADRIVDLI